ncbi:MAG: Fic family protein [Candidatus Rokuibacteriota bacterium]|nr:MAG: Fic family protein [Candidatus Rokubacteria bacterium]
MLYASPTLDRAELDVIARIEEIRGQIRFVVADAGDTTRGLLPLYLPGESNDPAFAGYRAALGYVLHLHDDPHFAYDATLLRSLHYMSLAHEPDKSPGRWRSAEIRVRGAGIWEVLYEPPPPEAVPHLVRELMDHLNDKDDRPAFVRAAVAHLNLVQIHPFADGNGRLGRALHTLVLVRHGILDPEFASIEQSVARDRDGFREALYELGTRWNPAADTRPFVRYCLAVHLQQGEAALDSAQRMSAVWAEAAREIQRRGLPERLTAALADAAFAGRVDAAGYRRWAGVDERRARADLKRLAEHGALKRARGTPGVSYLAGRIARDIRARAWRAHPARAPYDPFRA